MWDSGGTFDPSPSYLSKVAGASEMKQIVRRTSLAVDMCSSKGTTWRQSPYASKAKASTLGEIAKCRDRLLAVPTARGKRRSPSTAVRYLATLSHAFAHCWSF